MSEDPDRRTFLGGAAATLATTRSPSFARGRPDVVVVGAGVFGAWTACRLLQDGASVLLVDAWGPAHARASSGGETWLIRTEYRGDPLYTRWAWESLAEWRRLSARHERSLFHSTGALYLYPQVDEPIGRSIALQRALGVPIEQLSPADLARRWPQIDTAGIAVGVFQPTMGALMARRAVQALCADFVAGGGRYRQTAVAPPTGGGGGRLDVLGSATGERLAAATYVFACGPWLPRLFPEVIGRRIAPTRQEVLFFAPDAGDTRFAPPRLPAWVDVSSPDLHYGFPDIEARGFKIALDRHGPPIDPDVGDRRVSDAGLAAVRGYLRHRFPALADRPLAESRVCQYENTDNGNFLLDRHPHWSNVWIAGGGSGHGFKHGPAVGRYVADMLASRGRAEPRFGLSAHA